jgi:hypothetical protein
VQPNVPQVGARNKKNPGLAESRPIKVRACLQSSTIPVGFARRAVSAPGIAIEMRARRRVRRECCLAAIDREDVC